LQHQLYLPPDWSEESKNAGKRWPVIVEYTGNQWAQSGSSGEVDGAALGYGLSAGKWIWVVLPYVAADHQHNQRTWWGDGQATVEYAKRNVPRICADFGGDASKVLLCGFSRGAIAVNYIGLYDDVIAKLWCGFVSHDHYDGVREWKGTSWGDPLGLYRESALKRLRRLKGRPVLVTQNEGTQLTQDFLKGSDSLGRFTFLDVPVQKIFPDIPKGKVIHPHTDLWMFVDSEARRRAWAWAESVIQDNTISGNEANSER